MVEMKKLIVIFGGAVGLYQGYFNIFHEIEKHFKCTIRRNTPFKFSCKIKEKLIEFRFCYVPTRDKNYYNAKKFLETKFKELVPPPADELSKKLKNAEKILLLGICGAFKGKKGTIHIPKEFKELFFKEIYIKYKEVLKVKTLNSITINNFLTGKMRGSKSLVVTSNITLSPNTIEEGKKVYLISLAEKLSKQGDIVDKESYQIVKYLKNKSLGIMFMTSDLLSVKKHMMTLEGFSPDKKKFAENTIKAIKIALEK